jgi:hypothetical protein
MNDVDAIGVVRKHRWMPVEAQRLRLQDDGCRIIVDLDTVPRDWLYTAIRERTIVKAAFACLLTPRQSVRAGLTDYARFADKIAKLPRGCVGVVKDLDTGLIADTPGARKAMLAVVREQLMRSHRGLAISEGMRRGRKALVLTELQDAKGEAIWRNVRKYPRWEDAEKALQEKVHKDLTRWSAHKFWKARVGAKPDQT